MRARLLIVAAVLAVFGTACGSSNGTSETDEVSVQEESMAEEDMHEDESMHDDEGMEHEDGEMTSEAPEGAIEISMTEFAYAPKRIEAKVGERLELFFTNDGDVDHEAVVGTKKDQDHHAEEMMGDMGGGHHGDLPAIDLAPGESGLVKVTFDEAGTYLIGCHYPGHYDAGMVGKIIVS